MIRLILCCLFAWIAVFGQTGSSALDAGKLSYTLPEGFPRTQQSKNQETVSINDFHQAGDSDYTAAFQRAMNYAAIHPGTRIVLPCDTGSKVGTFFNITHGISIPAATTLEGTSRAACFINYSPSSNPGDAPAILSLVGSDGVTLRGFTISSNSKFPPKAAILMERNKKNGAAGHHVVQDVIVQGKYTVAGVYSISSEENLWLSDSIFVFGGGAKAAFYTAPMDHYKVCSSVDCQNGRVSNLSLWMIATHVINGQAGGNGIDDVLEATGVGDHSYSNVYIGLHSSPKESGAGFLLEGPQQGTGTNSAVHIISSRVENGGYFARFVNGPNMNHGTISNITARDNTYVSQSGINMFYAAPGLALDWARFSDNNASGTPTNSSSFDRITHSTLDEDYQSISVRSFAQDNRFLGSSRVATPVYKDDENLWAFSPNASHPEKPSLLKPPSGLQLRPGGNGDGSAWGPSMNLPNGCCGPVPFPNPKAGDIFAEDSQPYYFDGSAPRPWLLGGVSSYSLLVGNPGNKKQPACSNNNRGQLWFVNGGAGSADHLQICRKAANNSYGWQDIF